jgi:hypothetical protein
MRGFTRIGQLKHAINFRMSCLFEKNLFGSIFLPQALLELQSLPPSSSFDKYICKTILTAGILALESRLYGVSAGYNSRITIDMYLHVFEFVSVKSENSGSNV